MVVMRIFFYLALLAALIITAYFSYLGYHSRRQVPPMLSEMKLPVCPDKPNCVSSQVSPDDSHYISPIIFQDKRLSPLKTAAQVIQSMGGNIHAQDNQLISATFHSPLFGFVDDLTLLWDDREGILHLHSASRVGHSDMGANRKRIATFKTKLINE